MICFNGEIVNENDFKIGYNNRYFLYGDGFFETIKVIKGIELICISFPNIPVNPQINIMICNIIKLFFLDNCIFSLCQKI